MPDDRDMPLGSADRIGIECADCGRTRWRRPRDLVGRGITLHTKLSVICERFHCSECREQGMFGKNVSVRLWMSHDVAARRLEADVLRTQAVRTTG
jgi:hypothetical protein